MGNVVPPACPVDTSVQGCGPYAYMPKITGCAPVVPYNAPHLHAQYPSVGAHVDALPYTATHAHMHHDHCGPTSVVPGAHHAHGAFGMAPTVPYHSHVASTY